ncbi:hypothetical protein [Xanthobacter autotrophicus]|uniref:hypothetical protein n=1 Tax=Xanthobacter autotrophicus TaxID=280 RepID=UPI00372BA3A9
MADRKPKAFALDNNTDTTAVSGKSPHVKAEPQVGDRFDDGTIFSGISPDTGKPMYARPVDESLAMQWKEAVRYAARFEGHGKPVGTFRVPTDGELSVLFQNRTKIGGFNETGSVPKGWYWASTLGVDPRDQRFSDGRRGCSYENVYSSVRLICS